MPCVGQGCGVGFPEAPTTPTSTRPIPTSSKGRRVAQERSITYVPLEDIRPAERNPKLHDTTAIIDQITRFGFTNPLIVDDRTGKLHAGHGRWTALVVMRTAGNNVPDGIRVGEDDGWLVPVVSGWRSRNNLDAEAALVGDNQTTRLAGWDDRFLSEILEDVNAFDPSMFEELRFTDEDMESLLAYSTDESDGDLSVKTDSGLESDSVSTGGDDEDDLPGEPPGIDKRDVRCPECGHHFQAGDH